MSGSRSSARPAAAHARTAPVYAALLLAAAAPGARALAPSRPASGTPAAVPPAAAALAGDVHGTVRDTATGQHLEGVELLAERDGRTVAVAHTDAFGRYTLHALAPGAYRVTARLIGFRPVTRDVRVGGASGAADREGPDFALASVAAALSAVTVTGASPVAVDQRTGDQRFKQNEFRGAPTLTTSQVLQQTMAGAARAPTGEVHIRGQHAEYTYFVDGVPVPAGISGSLNELFDPQVVGQMNFITGGWDAEYGNKNAAVVNVTTRVPAGGFHADVGSYAGSYPGRDVTGGRGVNGQTASASNSAGRWGFFASGARQFSDMRREPVVFDTARGRTLNFHNDGTDLFGFGKVVYTAGPRDVVNLVANASRTRFQVPYDSTGGVFSDDRQTDVNSFVNLTWRHQLAERPGATGDGLTGGGLTGGGRTGGGRAPAGAGPGDAFAGVFYRHGSLAYDPSARDSAQFVFAPDTVPYSLRERRDYDAYGVVASYTAHPARPLEVKVGTQSWVTRGREDFAATSAQGLAGPASDAALSGRDVGLYAQTAYTPWERVELRTGVRYDAHRAPFAGTETQVSPRVRLNLYPTPGTTLYAYYGRLFLPTNVEDLRAITSSALGDAVTPTPTLPERDHFYELGAVQRLAALGTTVKVAGYRKQSSPGIDDNTVPGSAIVTSVNIARVQVTGVEAVVEVRPAGPFSAYVNAALNHAWGEGSVAGGFFPVVPPSGRFDLDHDQRLSMVASGYYTRRRFDLSATGIYGSGLTNGVDPADCDCRYGTGLFDFNRGIKVRPSAILNLSAGTRFAAGRTVVRPQLYVENVFDTGYLLKGAFFSGASVGRPRSVQLRVNVGI